IPTPHNLPAHVTPIFGREQDIALLTERVGGSDHRFITLVGEGGLGKSRLVQEIGWRVKEQFADGVWFVPLAGVASRAEAAGLENDIATAIAAAMGHSLRGQTPPKEQLWALLRDRRTLLLLDNFEHLLDGADLVIELLQEAQQLRVICTSREPLGFMAEWVYRLGYLPLPPLPQVADVELAEAFFSQTAVSPVTPQLLADFPSVRLFLDRAERANGRFALTADNQTQVAQLCRLTSGIPLALELAAAGLRQWSLAELIAAMQDALDALATRFRDIPARHRTVRAVFESSWHLLTAAEQQLFASLSVFRGGFTLAAATAVAGATEASLEGLHGKSLLQLAGERYQLHELLRQFAAEKLDEAARLVHFPNMNQSLASKHSSYYLNFVAEQEQPLAGATPQIPARAIAADLDNVRLAWQTGLAGRKATLLLAALTPFSIYYQLRGLSHEAEAVMQITVRMALAWGDEGVALATRAGLERARFQNRLGRYRPAIQAVQAALALAAEYADRWAEGMGLVLWGEALWRLGEYDASANRLSHALDLAHALDDRLIIGWCHHHLGIINDIQSRYAAAHDHLQQACAAWRDIENAHALSGSLNSIGLVCYHQGHLPAAQQAMEQALTLCNQLDNRHLQSFLLNNLSIVATAQGDYSGAQYYLQLGLEVANAKGDLVAQGLVYTNLGKNYRLLGDNALAAEKLRQGLQISESIGDPSLIAIALFNLAETEGLRGKAERAEALYGQALDMARQSNLPSVACEILISMAEFWRGVDKERARQSGAEAVVLAKLVQNQQLLERANAVVF
ncbi:MAG: tetratricopeptide repeat protein, partial [Anaerolineales bacterium]|nr:tetratricopeptide repeat protein [Anaerolineales bacterium]